MELGERIMKKHSKVVRQPVFRLSGWCKDKKPIERPPVEKFNPARYYQEQCYHALKSQRLAIINGPTSCGKSMMSDMIFYSKLKRNPKLRGIHSVPQTIIGDGFAKEYFIHPETKAKISYVPNLNLCDATGTDTSKVQALLTFLRCKPTAPIPSRLAVCSHATLVDAFQQEPKLFKNVVINIDESQHISYGQWIENENKEITNEIGAIVQYCIKNKSCHLLLTTATFFRNDRIPIVPEKYMDLFKRFSLPWDVFLPYTGINKFSYDFWMYDNGDFLLPLMQLFKHQYDKTIVYIDPRGGDDKQKYVTAVLQAIAQAKTSKGLPEESEDGITYIKRGKQTVEVVDLVFGGNNMEKKKKLIQKAHKSSDPNTIRVLIALHRFKEGANLKHLNRAILIHPRGSIVDNIQIPGRLFRKATGKDSVQIHTLLRMNHDYSSEEYKDNINTYVNATMGCLLLEQVMAPRLITVNGERVSLLNQLFEDEHVKQDLIEAAFKTCLENVNEETGDIDNQDALEEIKYLINQSIENETLTLEETELVAYELIALFNRHNDAGGEQRREGEPRLLPVENFTDINEWKQNLIGTPTIELGAMLKGFGGAFGLHTLKQVRKALIRCRWPDCFDLLKKYVKVKGHARVPANYVAKNGRIV
jgi:hypothetical protein